MLTPSAPRLYFALLLGAFTGCTTAGGVSLRSDGSPGPEKCPEEALKAMQILGLGVGDGGGVELDVNQADDSPITLYEGPIESSLNYSLGPLSPATRLYGRVWAGGPQVVIRYYEAHPPNRTKIPICAVARLARGQMKKRPESKPGTAILEYSSAGVFVVDAFR
ncbi:serine/threonine protein kinase [Stigmatella sp. ncwal1]|uniref:Serine/threonine protein kinase n=1 Tax=Stigmatella ashevillensis TaxID=2995309 RepID=A0ABT5DCX1_9BACT|nr:serine/threonine protein kinase [Stigmatella ashevillena]MDC0711517.1 serine/threonine protein kinase [Stigmatella ashevillena]